MLFEAATAMPIGGFETSTSMKGALKILAKDIKSLVLTLNKMAISFTGNGHRMPQVPTSLEISVS